jgi:Sec1 family
MYADSRLLIIPGIKQRPGAHNYELAHEFIMNQIDARPKELSRLQTNLKFDSPTQECAVEYMAYEPSLFSLDMPDTLSTVYTHGLASNVLEGKDLEQVRDSVFDHLDTVAYRIMTACVTMNELPFVRYAHSSRGISEVVARSLAKQLKIYKEDHPSFLPWGDPRATVDQNGQELMGAMGGRILRSGEPPEPATVIVVDRVDDLAPAVLHDITYTCLVTDLLDHEPCTPFHFRYRRGENYIERDVLLDDNDPVWRLLRYEDMGAVIDQVDEGVRMANQRAEHRKALNAQDVNDLRELMQAVTGDEKLVDEKFSQHYRMKGEIVDCFEKRNMHDICTLEQILATGCNSDGDKVSVKEIDKMMKSIMADDRLQSDDKARLLVLYILCNKSVDVKVRNELLSLSKISKKHQTAILNLGDLHVPLSRVASEPKSEAAPFYDEETLRRNRKLAQETRKLCRYTTKIEDIVANHLKGQLPEDEYPWVRQPPSRDSKVSATQLPNNVAVHGAHGEVVNKYTAEVLAAGNVNANNKEKGRRTKKSRLAQAEQGPGDYSEASSGGGGSKEPANDPFSRAMEPVKPRLYEGGRVIVFVVGGVTQLEIAALERLSKEQNREIVYGGTSLLTPRDFLEQAHDTDPEADKHDSLESLDGMMGDLAA